MDELSKNKIPFGLRNGILVDVSEVESGLACNCVCPECKGKLQARKGFKVTHYFAHDPSSNVHNCRSAFETSVHLMAKQILSEEMYINFPNLFMKVENNDDDGENKNRIILNRSALGSL